MSKTISEHAFELVNKAKTISKKFNVKIKDARSKNLLKTSREQMQCHLKVIELITFLNYLFLWKLLRKGSKRRGILILGLCESGKTQLFSQLCYGKDVVSVTSIKESSAEFVNGKKSLTVYDLPGHERIRYAAFEKVKNLAKAIIFVVDSATIQKDLRDVAEFLYTVLCDGAIQSGCPQVLIVCNKQDLTLAKAASLVQKTLEKEMNLLRTTQASQLQSVGDGSNNNVFLGSRGKDFDFSQLPLKVSFVEASTATTNGEPMLQAVTNWVKSVA
ncbi:unnamed protein product, partial [Meganyctiphanes norvegica]